MTSLRGDWGFHPHLLIWRDNFSGDESGLTWKWWYTTYINSPCVHKVVWSRMMLEIYLHLYTWVRVCLHFQRGEIKQCWSVRVLPSLCVNCLHYIRRQDGTCNLFCLHFNLSCSPSFTHVSTGPHSEWPLVRETFVSHYAALKCQTGALSIRTARRKSRAAASLQTNKFLLKSSQT